MKRPSRRQLREALDTALFDLELTRAERDSYRASLDFTLERADDLTARVIASQGPTTTSAPVTWHPDGPQNINGGYINGTTRTGGGE